MVPESGKVGPVPGLWTRIPACVQSWGSEAERPGAWCLQWVPGRVQAVQQEVQEGPVSPGRRPARGRQAGGAEFLPAGCLALTASSLATLLPLLPSSGLPWPSVSALRSRPPCLVLGHTGDGCKTVTE